MITLKPFLESDCDSLIAAIPDARFLLQWAGPNYRYPMDLNQLRKTMAKASCENPSFKLFKALLNKESKVIGHIQLMNIDYTKGSCRIGRVMIFPGHRGRGLGKEMVRLAIREAFDDFGLDEITLGVFDFNKAAIATYQSLGFKEVQVRKRVFTLQNETFNLMEMKLTKP